jgi:anti-sigma factor RsiW
MVWRRYRSATLRCEDAREAISARLDGEHPQLSDRTVESHLSVCDSCREYEALAPSLSRLSLRASKSPPPALTPLLTSLLSRQAPNVGAPFERPLNSRRSILSKGSGPPKRAGVHRVHVARWAAGLIPAIAAAVVLPLGASAHTRVVPTRNPTPCTARLHPGVDHAGSRSSHPSHPHTSG